MPYIASGEIVNGRPASWGVSSISGMFWGFVNFMVLFFHTMWQPDLTRRGTGMESSYQSGTGRPPPQPPRRRMGGFGGRGGGPAAPPMGGGG